MTYLQNFLSTKDISFLPKLGTKAFRCFTKRRDYFSMRLFFYNFCFDNFTFFYYLDNEFLKGRNFFSDTIKRRFRLDLKKNRKISNVIRPFGTYLFKIRQKSFFILTSATLRKKFRRSLLWEKIFHFNKKSKFSMYQKKNNGLYNPYFLQFGLLSGIYSVMNVVSKNKNKKRISKKASQIRFFEFFRKFNKNRR